MTDKKISELTEVTAPAGTDVLPIVSGGDTKKVTRANLSAHDGLDIYEDTGVLVTDGAVIAAADPTHSLVLNAGDQTYDSGTANAALYLQMPGGEPVIFLSTNITDDGGNAAYIQLTQVGSAGEILLHFSSLLLSTLPTADPGVAHQVYSDGVPSAGNPKVLKISGG